MICYFHLWPFYPSYTYDRERENRYINMSVESETLNLSEETVVKVSYYEVVITKALTRCIGHLWGGRITEWLQNNWENRIVCVGGGLFKNFILSVIITDNVPCSKITLYESCTTKETVILFYNLCIETLLFNKQ